MLGGWKPTLTGHHKSSFNYKPGQNLTFIAWSKSKVGSQADKVRRTLAFSLEKGTGAPATTLTHKNKQERQTSMQTRPKTLQTTEAKKSRHLLCVLSLQYLQHYPSGQSNCNLSAVCKINTADFYKAMPLANSAARLSPAALKSEAINSNIFPFSSLHSPITSEHVQLGHVSGTDPMHY